MADAIYRYEVPVDDRWHPLQLSGRIVHVDCRDVHAVEVWAIHTNDLPETRTFRVYGTGHTLPPDVQHVGTAIAPGGQLVWHLIETP
ncbi:hypothetical protein PV377_03170 [Streptomyces ipomoeae]|uniref:DUF7352 domain-containing protein n=1 Tax=Streptomyces ipomoeae TaxID=103232 RepID=UPI0029B77221|nr:hypothetical protein [Streptomyces ipomoeae]MDX2838014.1 hypothetical protein [Streptomyces ipomoeae]